MHVVYSIVKDYFKEELVLNLKELSEKIEVSASTISRVLNDKPGISEATRKKVLAAIEKEHFTLNFAGRNLVKSESRFIGIISRKRTSVEDVIFFHHSLNQFQEILLQNNYFCVPISYHDDKGIDFENTPLSPTDYAGFIIRGQSIPQKVILSVKKFGVPIILLENAFYETKVNSVVCNDAELEYELTKILIDKGHKRIVHITGPDSWYNNKERIKGYRSAINEAKIPEELYCLEDTVITTGKEAFDILKITKVSNIGICFVNDAMAIGFLKVANDKNIKIGENISVVGFDDIPWASLTTPPLTTARIEIDDMGKLASSRLLAMIGDSSASVTVKSIVDGKIIKRKTT